MQHRQIAYEQNTYCGMFITRDVKRGYMLDAEVEEEAKIKVKSKLK